MLRISLSSVIATTTILLLSGCSQSSPILKVNKDNAEQYKIFQPSLLEDEAEVRKSAIDKANKFCTKSNGKMVVISERTNKPPYIIDNFPGIEIIFACEGGNNKHSVENKDINSKQKSWNRDKYSNLAIIKKLLDDGTLTQQEFDEEKRKILADD
jgi:hypothetical protein